MPDRVLTEGGLGTAARCVRANRGPWRFTQAGIEGLLREKTRPSRKLPDESQIADRTPAGLADEKEAGTMTHDYQARHHRLVRRGRRYFGRVISVHAILLLRRCLQSRPNRSSGSHSTYFRLSLVAPAVAAPVRSDLLKRREPEHWAWPEGGTPFPLRRAGLRH